MSIVAEYPTIDEPREAPDALWPTRPARRAGPIPPWSKPETYVRWGLTGFYVIGVAGLASTLGGTVAPWLGWIVLLIASGGPALLFWGRYLEHQNTLDRTVRGVGAGPGGGPRFTGGTSFGAGPGRDDEHRQSVSDDDEDATSYP